MATIINNVTDLQNMSLDLAGDYELGGDIDAAATSGWNGGLGFAPIGTSAVSFTGTLDGKGYTISDLFIDRPATDDIGLFGGINGATITDVIMTGCDITGDENVGCLFGFIVSGTVSGCTTAGAVVAHQDGGGLFGSMTAGTVTSCSSSATVTSDDVAGAQNFGGLFGSCYGGTISQCKATGDVDGGSNEGDFSGGFMGRGQGTLTISECSATGDVVGELYVGGFAGTTLSGNEQIEDCYARGDATGEIVAAFIADNAGTIERSYGTGLVTTTGVDEGGFCAVGYNSGTITDCFWDTDTTGQAASDGGTGKTTLELQIIVTFTDAGWASWWFAKYGAIWVIPQWYGQAGAYPVLAWENSRQWFWGA